MNTSDLDRLTRKSAFIGDATSYPAYDTNKLLDELNDKLQTVFQDAVVGSRSGYWLKKFVNTIVAGQSQYQIPDRSCVQGLEKLEFSPAVTGPWTILEQLPANREQTYRASTTTGTTATWYTLLGDTVDIIPTPPAGAGLRMTYYQRPSRLYPPQSIDNTGAGTSRGKITSIAGIGSRQVVVDVIPFDQSLASPGAMTTGQQLIDIVHGAGWHELRLVGATQTFSGTTITIGGTDDLSLVKVGDYVRVADQTDWPCIPEEFHRCLCDAAAVKILLELGLQGKSDALAANNGNDILRMKKMIYPRDKSQPREIPMFLRSRDTGTRIVG